MFAAPKNSKGVRHPVSDPLFKMGSMNVNTFQPSRRRAAARTQRQAVKAAWHPVRSCHQILPSLRVFCALTWPSVEHDPACPDTLLSTIYARSAHAVVHDPVHTNLPTKHAKTRSGRFFSGGVSPFFFHTASSTLSDSGLSRLLALVALRSMS